MKLKLKQRFSLWGTFVIFLFILSSISWGLFDRPEVLANYFTSTPSSWTYMPLVMRPLNTPTPTMTPPTPIFLPTNTPITQTQPGYWTSDDAPIHFFVTLDGGYVDEFSVVTFAPCGTITIYITELLPILNSHFSFDGQFYGNGTFDTFTTAHGQFGVDNIYVDECGLYVNFDLTEWTAYKYVGLSSLLPLRNGIENLTPAPPMPHPTETDFQVKITRHENIETPLR